MLLQPTCTTILYFCAIFFYFIYSKCLFSQTVVHQETSPFSVVLPLQIFDISWDLYQPNKLVSCGVKHMKVWLLVHLTSRVSRLIQYVKGDISDLANAFGSLPSSLLLPPLYRHDSIKVLKWMYANSLNSRVHGY